jgi:hypothetical protein
LERSGSDHIGLLGVRPAVVENDSSRCTIEMSHVPTKRVKRETDFYLTTLPLNIREGRAQDRWRLLLRHAER